MHTSTSKRPFFSVVIPCYNPKKQYLDTCLTSLISQNFSKQELEVIIVDDRSTLDYNQYITPYEDKLNIKRTQTEINSGVGGTREKGAQIATGVWLTFIDIDDYFKTNSFIKIKKIIEENPNISLLEAGIDYLDQETNRVVMRYLPSEHRQEKGYLHGKFFNLDNFWKKYGLSFKNLRSSEDLAICSQIETLIHGFPNDVVVYKTSFICYQWYHRRNSFTTRVHYYKDENIPRSFSDRYFNNYVKGTIKIFFQACKKGYYNQKDGFKVCCEVLYLVYHRSERDFYNVPHQIIQNYKQLHQILLEILSFFNITIYDINKYFLQNREYEKRISKYAHDTGGRPYKCKHSFLQWMQIMSTSYNLNQEKTKRPFFSIIIPCYNSRKTIGHLLETITKQDLPKQDIQVVISDDCSTESYQDIIDQFTDRLFITQVKTDYNYCPGNTRQRGADAAIGEWICFSDHDDEFVLGSLKYLKDTILSCGCKTAFFSKFLKKTLEGEYIQMPQNAGWTHGKFFNLDNFWKKYNLHYPKDLTSHEDVSLCTQIEYIRLTYGEELYQGNFPTYIWVSDPNSLSNRKYVAEQKERIFLDVFYMDYADATAGISYKMYKTLDKKNPDFVRKNIRDVMMYSYFYLEYAKDVVPEYLVKNYRHVRKYLKILNDEFNCSIDDIYNYFKFENKEAYVEIFKIAFNQTGIFVYERSFHEWLKWIWEEGYEKA